MHDHTTSAPRHRAASSGSFAAAQRDIVLCGEVGRPEIGRFHRAANARRNNCFDPCLPVMAYRTRATATQKLRSTIADR